MTNQLAAVSPSELAASQIGVLEHCVQRINALKAEQREAEECLQEAMQGNWNLKPFRNRLNRLARKSAYYQKIGEAVRKGYLIIPDVWSSDIFAIRVKDKDTVRWNKWGAAQLQKLPIGEGKYVDAMPVEHKESYRDDKGNTQSRVYWRHAADDIDFPVSAVHPSVIQASEIAMSDRVFDTLRIATQGGDPFILGEICHPTTQYKSITFFVAWFLDVKTL